MIKRKLYIYFILIIIIAVVISNIITTYIVTNNYKSQIENELRSLLGVTSLYIDSSNNTYNVSALNISNQLSKFANEDKDIRVTIINNDGEVLGDSEVDYLNMQNHIYREEVKEAISNEIGLSIRKSTTTNIEYMYLALYKDNIILRLSYPLSNIVYLKKQIYLFSLIGGLIAIVIASILALKLSSNISQPIALLSEHSKEIAKGNYNHRIIYNHKQDELKNLINTYNNMTNQLQNSFTSINNNNQQLDAILNSVNDGIIVVDNNGIILFTNNNLDDFDFFLEIKTNNHINTIMNSIIIDLLSNSIKNMKSYHNEINISNNWIKCFSTYIPFKEGNGAIITLQDITKIKKATTIRNEFVSNVTHELNTPLTSIQGFIETLKSNEIMNVNTRNNFLDIIDIEAQRLKELINDILTLSSIENSSNIDKATNIKLKNVTDTVINLLSKQIKEKNIKIINNINSSTTIKMHLDRTKQLFINLIDNAIKYNTNNGSIEIFTTTKDNFIQIHFKDSGIGIEKKHLNRLFERFYRVDKSRSRNLGGTGLGLSIVKHITLLYKGHVKVTSQIDKGSEVIVTIPL